MRPQTGGFRDAHTVHIDLDDDRLPGRAAAGLSGDAAHGYGGPEALETATQKAPSEEGDAFEIGYRRETLGRETTLVQ
jgi:hypothetical protein